MMRVANWDSVLRAWAATQLGAPYVWGRTDCVSLTTTGLQQLYPAPLGLPAFPTKHAALRALLEDPALLAGTLTALGAVAVALPFAQAGDVLEPPPDLDEPAVLLCLGAATLATAPAEGVHLVPTLALPPTTRAWRLAHG